MHASNLLGSTKRIGIGLSFIIFPIVFVFDFSVHPGLLHPHFLGSWFNRYSTTSLLAYVILFNPVDEGMAGNS